MSIRTVARGPSRLLAAAVSAVTIAATVAVAGLSGTAAAADPLISQGKPATASSTENAGTPASAAVDGNTGTRWSSAFSDPQWIQVDLGATATITQVVLNWEAAYAPVVPDPDRAGGHRTVHHDLLDHHRHRRHPDAPGHRLRPVRADERHRAGHPVTATRCGSSRSSARSAHAGCGTANAALSQPGHRLVHRERRRPRRQRRGRRQHRHPLVQSAFSDPQWLQVDLGATATVCQVVLTWEAAYATRVPDPDRAGSDRARWTDDLLDHHRHRRHPDADRHRHRPLRPDVRHRPGHRSYGYSLWEFAVFGTTGGTRTDTAAGRHARRRRPRRRTSSSSTRRMSTATDPEPGSTRSSRQQETEPVRHPAVRAAVQAGHLQRQRQRRLLHLGRRPRPEPGRRQHQRRRHRRRRLVPAATPPRTSGARRRTCRSTPAGGTDRWAVVAGRAVPPDARARRPQPRARTATAGPPAATSPTPGSTARSARARSSSGSPATARSAAGPTRVWNMVFVGVAGRAGAELPEPAVHHGRAPPRSSGRSRTCTSTRPAPTRCSCRRCAPTPPAPPGPAAPRRARRCRSTSSTSPSPATRAATINAGARPGPEPAVHARASTTSTRPSTSPAPTPSCSASASPRSSRTTASPRCTVADVDGVKIAGLLFDAGTTNSPVLLQVGPAGSSAEPRRQPDHRCRTCSSASAAPAPARPPPACVVNSNNTIIDHIWAWRADHGTRRRLDRQHRRQRPDRQRQQRHRVRPVRRALPEVRGDLERQRRPDVSSSRTRCRTTRRTRPPGRTAAPTGYAAYKVADTRHQPRGVGAGQLLLLQRQPERSSPTTPSRCRTTPDVQFHDMLTVSLGGNGHHQPRHQQHRGGRAGHRRPSRSTSSASRSRPVRPGPGGQASRAGPATARTPRGCPGSSPARPASGPARPRSPSRARRSRSPAGAPARRARSSYTADHQLPYVGRGRGSGTGTGVCPVWTLPAPRPPPGPRRRHSSRRRRPRRRRTCRTGRGR